MAEGPCDVPESCDGSSASCPPPSVSACGLCGAAAGESWLGAPSADLCAVGVEGPVSGEGPWAWTCEGVGGGPGAGCSADRSCPAGVVTWLASCSAAVADAPHGASGVVASTAPGYSGSAVVTCAAGTWSTSGEACVAIIAGACGAADGQSTLGAPTSGLCAAGEPCSVSQSTQASGFSGALANTAGGYAGSATATCTQGTWSTSATSCIQTINGSCGAANGGSTLTTPSAGLCAAGTATAVSGAGPYSWSCTGQGGGTTASCSANKSCAAQSLVWNTNCSASQSLQSSGYSGTLTNTASGYTGSATASCSQGSWSTSGGTCAVSGCTPGATQSCGTCHCGIMQRTCLANGTWGTCTGDGCQPAGQACF